MLLKTEGRWLTYNLLKANNACQPALDWFEEHFLLRELHGFPITLSYVIYACPNIKWIEWLKTNQYNLWPIKSKRFKLGSHVCLRSFPETPLKVIQRATDGSCYTVLLPDASTESHRVESLIEYKANAIKNPKITLEILRIDKGACFRVLDMDERFRSDFEWTSYGTKHIISYEEKRIKIRSAEQPGILPRGETIWLWGSDKSHDNDWMVVSFESNEEVEKYINELKETLKSWSENWEGFLDGKPISETRWQSKEKSEIFKWG